MSESIGHNYLLISFHPSINTLTLHKILIYGSLLLNERIYLININKQIKFLDCFRRSCILNYFRRGAGIIAGREVLVSYGIDAQPVSWGIWAATDLLALIPTRKLTMTNGNLYTNITPVCCWIIVYLPLLCWFESSSRLRSLWPWAS